MYINCAMPLHLLAGLHRVATSVSRATLVALRTSDGVGVAFARGCAIHYAFRA